MGLHVRLNDICVLMEAEIRDDLIDMARIRSSTPANASAMILAFAIDHMPRDHRAGVLR